MDEIMTKINKVHCQMGGTTFSELNMRTFVAAAIVRELYDAAAHSPILMRTVSKRDFKKKV